MRILDFLAPENVVAPLAATDKEGILRELCATLTRNGALENPDMALEAVMTRERLGSTGIGEQVAIPHAKTRGASRLAGAFGLTSDEVDYDAVDDQPVRLVFLLVAGEDATSAHLKALARISRMLKNRSFRDRAREATSAEQLFALVRAEDEALG
ncbi:MAG: PTS sugar transporter subunit IIA [Nitrospinae bacterium]|nr:PTS sugar transporter subunit IIA [Nitrospinota bacterium]